MSPKPNDLFVSHSPRTWYYFRKERAEPKLKGRGHKMYVENMYGSRSGCRRPSAVAAHECWEPMRKIRLGRKKECLIKGDGDRKRTKLN